MPAPIRLTVVFSRGMSLRGWQQAGILDRELALYQRLRAHLDQLTFVTYGGADEQALAAAVPGAHVLCNRWRLPANVYSVLAPVLHGAALLGTTHVRTNQLNGAWMAARIARQTKARLIARGGFLWSDFVARLHPGSWRVRAAQSLERRVYTAADAVVATTAADAAVITRRYRLAPERVHVVPNFVDTAQFRLSTEGRASNRVLFVGRLDPQKNLVALLDALNGLDATLDIVGDGPLRASLETHAAVRGGRVRFLGTRPHAELPALMQAATIFVLPSAYEGHPKALLEAMACGAPVVGAASPGITDVIQDDVTGVLAAPVASDLHSALAALLNDGARRARLGAAAAAYVQRTCSLDAVAAQELQIWQSLAAR